MLGMAHTQDRAPAPSRCFRRTIFLISLLLCTGSFSPRLACLAQSKAMAENTLAFASSSLPTINKQVEEVGLVITVTNGSGRFVQNLSESDFNILDNDRSPERITYFQAQTNLPLRVAVVLDTSDSVTYRFNFEQRAASTFFKHVLHPPDDLGMIVGFNQEVHIAQLPTHNIKGLNAALKDLRLGGETAVYDAVITASRELAAIPDQQPSRHAIILISDGEDNRSHAQLQEAIESVLRSNSVVYVVSTNSSEYAVGVGQQGDSSMRELAEATGGRLLRADSDGDVGNAFSKIERELRSQYAIGYKPSSDGPDGLFHRLIVLGPKKLRIFHRRGYFAR